MYLYRETFVGGNHEYRDVQGTVELSYNNNDNERLPINVDIKSLVSVTEHLLYWRKANAIHGWFVDNCGDGEDNAQLMYVTEDKMKELLETIDKQLKDKVSGILPLRSGFFFGNSEEKDAWYWDELKRTKKEFEKLLKEPGDHDYYYQASW